MMARPANLRGTNSAEFIKQFEVIFGLKAARKLGDDAGERRDRDAAARATA
jgi:hypothetical protein